MEGRRRGDDPRRRIHHTAPVLVVVHRPTCGGGRAREESGEGGDGLDSGFVMKDQPVVKAGEEEEAERNAEGEEDATVKADWESNATTDTGWTARSKESWRQKMSPNAVRVISKHPSHV